MPPLLEYDATAVPADLAWLTPTERGELDALLWAQEDAEQTATASAHLRPFLDGAWPVLEPGTALTPGWHLDAIAEYLEAVSLGQIRRLVINVPPRSLKSTLVTICWPVWSWIARPESRWLFASYSQSLSEDHSVKRRVLLTSAWYQARWGARFRLADDQNAKREFKNDHQGTMIATSMDGAATGKGGGVLVIDDPHNPQGAESDAERATTIRNFDLVFQTRLDDPKTGAIVIVMQRLHEQDLTAHCLAQGYDHLCLPMRAEERTRVVFPVTQREVVREPGALLNADRWPLPVVEALETALGSYGAAGQLQQRPAPQEGGKLKRHWWRFWHYPDAPLPPVPVRRADGTTTLCPCVPLPAHRDPATGGWIYDLAPQIQSWDLAFKDAKDSDFVAGGVWGAAGADAYLLDRVHARLNVLGTVDAILALTARWPAAGAKLIEDKANGPAVMQMLQSKVGGLIPVEPQGGKMARVMACSPFVEAGNVYLPHPQILPGVQEVINEAAAFPNGANDDDVDQLTQALIRLIVAPGQEWTAA